MAAVTLKHDALRQRSRPWLAAAAIALLARTGMWAWREQQEAAPAAVEPVAVAELATVTALGRLEPEGELIRLSAPTSTQESRVEQLLVAEGDRVAVGQVVALLDSKERLEAALRRAEEQVRVARAQRARVEAGAQTGELEAQRAEIARLQAEQAGNLQARRAAAARLDAEVENARVEFERYQLLYDEGAVSASLRDSKQLLYTTAQRQLQEVRAEIARIETTSREQIQRARSTLDQLAEVRPVDVEVAAADVRAAIVAVAEAEANLEQASVRSPRAGQIVKIHTRPGELVGEEGIVTLGQTEQMMAVAEVYQTDVGAIRVGQPATVTASALDEPLSGTVERVGLQVERQQVVNEDPAANIDAKVVEVRVRLDRASSQAVSDLSNLQVTVQVQTQATPQEVR